MTNQVVMSRLSVRKDSTRNLLWFSGTTDAGYRFDVGFPVAQVALMFEEHLTDLGYCGAPVCGDVEIITCDGFFSHLGRAVVSPNRSVAGAVRTAYKTTMGRVASSATRYGNKGAAVCGDTGAVSGRDAAAVAAEALKNLFAQLAVNAAPVTTAERAVAAKFGYTIVATGKNPSDVVKLRLLGKVPNSYLPYNRATNPHGYVTSAIISAQRVTMPERAAINAAYMEVIDPGWAARLVAMSEGQKKTGTDKSLGLKSVGNAVASVATFAVKPVTGLVKAGVAIGHGANILATAREYGKTTVQDAAKVAAVAGTVASVVPGIGTGASFALHYAGSVSDAAVSGKNLYNAAQHAAVEAVLNSLPGGELTRAVIEMAAKVAIAGVQGQNLLRSARNELVAGAIGLVPSAEAQAVLKGAADAAISGKNVLSGAASGMVQAALAQIPDPSARLAVQATLQGKSPTVILGAASASLLARAAACAPTGGVAGLVTGMTGANPNQIHAAAVKVLGSTGAVPTSRLLPAIGGAALGAVGAARSATSAIATGNVAASLIANGSRDLAHVAAVRTASAITNNVANLARVNTMGSLLVTSAMKSLPASPGADSVPVGSALASRLLPAIGGAALGAYGAARSADRAVAVGKVAANLVAKGSRSPAHIAAVRRASVVTNNVAGLVHSNTMGSFFVTSAMKSLPARAA